MVEGLHMAIATKEYTADELLNMPDDGFRYELLRGELRKMPPAGHQHGRIAMNLATPLDQHVRANELGVVYAAETGFKLAANPDTVRAPDVAFVCKGRLGELKDASGFFPGAPDLAVEVVSPGDTYGEVENKVFDWLAAGAQVVIVVTPRTRTVTVYRSLSDIQVLTERDTLQGGDLVPGWTLPVHGIFD
jgi:Uma2 family endonuclease